MSAGRSLKQRTKNERELFCTFKEVNVLFALFLLLSQASVCVSTSLSLGEDWWCYPCIYQWMWEAKNQGKIPFKDWTVDYQENPFIHAVVNSNELFNNTPF